MNTQKMVNNLDFIFKRGQDGNKLLLSEKQLNAITRSKYEDYFGFWQRQFGLYTFLQINDLREYEVRRIKGFPATWNKWESCIGYTESGHSITRGKKFRGCPTYWLQTWCHDEYMKSCFEHLIQWDRNGRQSLSPEGQQAFNIWLKETMVNAAQGLRNTLTLGQYYDFSDPQLKLNGMPMELQMQIQNKKECMGWARLAVDMANDGYPWMNCSELIGKNTFSKDCKYQGDIKELVSELKCKAPKALQTLIRRGAGTNMDENGRSFRALLVVSDSFADAIVDAYNAQCDHLAQNCERITREVVNGVDVYYVDRMPVVPSSELSCYDEYLNVDLHFIGIVASGNIQLGTNFGEIEGDLENQNIGMIIEQNTSIRPYSVDPITKQTNYEYGRWSMLSHALTTSVIADPDYFVGAFGHTVSTSA